MSSRKTIELTETLWCEMVSVDTDTGSFKLRICGMNTLGNEVVVNMVFTQTDVLWFNQHMHDFLNRLAANLRSTIEEIQRNAANMRKIQ